MDEMVLKQPGSAWVDDTTWKAQPAWTKMCTSTLYNRWHARHPSAVRSGLIAVQTEKAKCRMSKTLLLKYTKYQPSNRMSNENGRMSTCEGLTIQHSTSSEFELSTKSPVLLLGFMAACWCLGVSAAWPCNVDGRRDKGVAGGAPGFSLSCNARWRNEKKGQKVCMNPSTCIQWHMKHTLPADKVWLIS